MGPPMLLHNGSGCGDSLSSLSQCSAPETDDPFGMAESFYALSLATLIINSKIRCANKLDLFFGSSGALLGVPTLRAACYAGMAAGLNEPYEQLSSPRDTSQPGFRKISAGIITHIYLSKGRF